ncbi:hypothetical protein SSP35_05_02030 [Streptomyces sp. NBRC 110611]|uniref:antibiotic biosynthesis monooxygenase n=1 Tax=Streptomyces sp. NBRC 110611 TaxID=1621259 RepID=UPI000858D0DC|nr:antibiotic biosynthesis monooxygenase [Streptomyces sp. NBRC 110611]GAU67636.1 hypothetical protein SSP35_05_02030 [Streptomyces sp. NBRC 110611]
MTSSHTDSHAHDAARSTRPASGTRDGFRADVFPEIRRPDAGHVLLGEWDAGSPEGQRAVQDGVVRAVAETPLPAGFLSRVLFAGTDGRGVLDYGQWTSEAAHRDFLRNDGGGLPERVTAALASAGALPSSGALPSPGGVGGPGPARYRLYRSMLPQGRPEAPGCVVRVAFRTAGQEAARELVDGLLDRVIGERQPGEGGIASHFHISEDGTRVVNYSEWTDAESHARVIGSMLRPDGRVIGFIESLPGVETLGFRRYVGPRGLVRA